MLKRPFRVGRSRTGLGLFATRVIEKGEVIARYIGRKILDKDIKRENRYMFEVNNRWTIDGAARSNLARYANHSCRPNAESDVNSRKHTVHIVARKTIKPGDEITYDYGKDYFDAFIKPIGCKCDKCLEKRKAERAEKRRKAMLARRRRERAAANGSARPQPSSSR